MGYAWYFLLILSLLYMIGLLGTSNSLVWGIDECVNTHHFTPIKDTKMTKNTQYILQISLVCVLCVSGTKGLKTKRKRVFLDRLDNNCTFDQVKTKDKVKSQIQPPKITK